MRRPERYAQAGFPTKIAESLALGTPVIINITSNLGDYIHDGVEGLICSDHSVGVLIVALKKALILSRDKKIQMRNRARKQAELSFDCIKYSQVLKEFIEVSID